MLKQLIAIVLTALSLGAFAAVDVNKAAQADLESIKGIGPAMSTKILDERKKGVFKDWPDLVGRVKGVGPNTAGKLSAQGLTVNGQAYQTAKAGDAKPARPADNAPAKAPVKPDAKATPVAR